jgi:hypothetical protein
MRRQWRDAIDLARIPAALAPVLTQQSSDLKCQRFLAAPLELINALAQSPLIVAKRHRTAKGKPLTMALATAAGKRIGTGPGPAAIAVLGGIVKHRRSAVGTQLRQLAFTKPFEASDALGRVDEFAEALPPHAGKSPDA